MFKDLQKKWFHTNPYSTPSAAFWHEMSKLWLEIDSSSEVGSWGEHIYKIIADVCCDIAQCGTLGQYISQTNDTGILLKRQENSALSRDLEQISFLSSCFRCLGLDLIWTGFLGRSIFTIKFRVWGRLSANALVDGYTLASDSWPVSLGGNREAQPFADKIINSKTLLVRRFWRVILSSSLPSKGSLDLSSADHSFIFIYLASIYWVYTPCQAPCGNKE